MDKPRIGKLSFAVAAALACVLAPGVAAAACPPRNDAPRPQLNRNDLNLAVARCTNEQGSIVEADVMAACNGIVAYTCFPARGGPLFSVDDLESLSWAYRLRANAHITYGRTTEALADLNDADAAQPRDFTTLLSRCRVRAATRTELDSALSDCNTAIELRPRTPFALDSRGLVHLQRGDYAAAIVDYDAAIAAEPNLVSSLYGRAIARARLGQSAESQADAIAATALDPQIVAEFESFGLSL
ncbi:MAG: tetratricopeptide repeat protein [Hyphomonadaceae bacterium]